MNISKRLFTYPVLSEDKDDYALGNFSVKCSTAMSGSEFLDFTFEIELDCPEIQALINTNKAEFVIHMESVATCFRTVVRGAANTLFYRVSVNKVRDNIDLLALVVLKEDLKGFSCGCWNEDFEGDSFDLEKGKLIAYQNLPSIKIIKNIEELQNAASIFVISRLMTEEILPFNVELGKERIKLELCSKDYDAYASLSGNGQWNSILNNMLILPALVYVFEELKQEDGLATYGDCDWFQALKLAYKKRGVDLESELSEGKSSLLWAQEAMELPFNKAINKIPLLINGDEVEEDS